jgi:hypothetical protein
MDIEELLENFAESLTPKKEDLQHYGESHCCECVQKIKHSVCIKYPDCQCMKIFVPNYYGDDPINFEFSNLDNMPWTAITIRWKMRVEGVDLIVREKYDFEGNADYMIMEGDFYDEWNRVQLFRWWIKNDFMNLSLNRTFYYSNEQDILRWKEFLVAKKLLMHDSKLLENEGAK